MPRMEGTQTRSFTYSGNNLVSATNPENGTVTYTYNSYNKVATKTDAKGQQMVYTYDTLARLTKAQKYPQGTSYAEDVCQQENYYYDTNPFDSTYSGSYTSGRLTVVQYYGGSTTYSSPSSPGSCDTTFQEMFDYSQPGGKIGKRLRVQRSLPTGIANSQPSTWQYVPVNADLNSTYTFDNEGRITAVQYPAYGPSGSQTAGPNLGYAMDTMGRLNTMTDLAAQSTIISATTYGPSNQLLTMSGNVNETRTYNSMLQLTQLTNGSVNINYSYPSTQNNGKISSQTDNISGEQVVYTYDALNRLASATATSGSWGQSYSYDGFANLTGQTVTTGSAPSYSVTPNPATNVVGSADANGNNTAAIGGAYPTYDVENRLTLVGYQGVQYSYATGNKRVWRGLWTSGTLTTDEVTFWSATGQKLATYQLSVSSANAPCYPQTWEECFSGTMVANQSSTNYYFGGKLIKNAGGYVGADRLGSIGKYYPYGQEKPSATTNGTEKFTGYFRDAETGLDYADQRYHNPGTGRFMTPDPYHKSARATDPRTWNRYSYTNGDPTNFIDPTGLDDDGFVAVCDPDDPTCGDNSGDGDGPGGWNYDYPCGVNGLVAVPGAGCVAEAAATTTVDSSDPTCTMQMYTRPVDDLKYTELGLAVTHSYLVFTNSNGGIVTVDGRHDRKKNLLTGGVAVGGYGPSNNPKSLLNWSDGPPVVIPCDDIPAAQIDAKNFTPVTYNKYGPNSNSFLHWLLNKLNLGGVYQQPIGAWGWNAQIPGNP
jgi:RHS repeat-associated protein